MECSGDNDVVCGGYWALSVYKYGEEDTSPESTDEVSGGMYGSVYSGDATYYGFTTEGNCNYKGNVPGMYDGMIPSEKTRRWCGPFRAREEFQAARRGVVFLRRFHMGGTCPSLAGPLSQSKLAKLAR